MTQSSSHKDTLVQGDQDQIFGLSISLDPLYSRRAYFNHQNIYREDDVIHFIHDLSPHITLRKDETLDDKDPPFQQIREGMNNDDRKENFPTKNIPSSSIYLLGSSKYP